MPRRLSTVHITYAISSGDQSTSCLRITGFGNPVSSLRSALSWLAAALAVGNSAAQGCTLHRRPLIGSYAVRLADWANAALLLIIRQAEGVAHGPYLDFVRLSRLGAWPVVGIGVDANGCRPGPRRTTRAEASRSTFRHHNYQNQRAPQDWRLTSGALGFRSVHRRLLWP